MHADRCVDMRIAFRQFQYAGEIRQVDRHAERMADFILGHLAEDFRHARSQFGEIDMTVGIDKHRPNCTRTTAFMHKWRTGTQAAATFRTAVKSGDPLADYHQVTLHTIQCGDARHIRPAFETETLE
ncbi:hypothetical protein D3C81_1915760 [compost metagenome]